MIKKYHESCEESTVAEKTILICGEKYSSNLGDAVISDCLSHLFSISLPDAQILRQDISGRTCFSNGMRRGKKNLFKKYLARTLPTYFSAASWLWKRCFSKDFQFNTSEVHLIIFGGGQLLMDNKLRFPLALLGLVIDAGKHQTPIVCHACGVGAKWSFFGRAILRFAFGRKNVKFISVRDENSVHNLVALLGSSYRLNPVITADPAVWAAEVYGVNKQASRERIIGLGIMDPQKARLNAQQPEYLENEVLREFWIEVVERVIQAGMLPIFFTNGAPDDEAFVDELISQLTIKFPDLKDYKKAFTPKRPEELVHMIAGFSGVIAHRLHASIIAFSLCIPAISLEWDPKVSAFNESVGRTRWSLKPAEANPKLVVERLIETIKIGVDREAVERTKESVKEETAYIAKMLL